MRVLLISPYYSPGVGGSSRLLKDIVDYLKSAGHYVEVLTYGNIASEECRRFDEAQSYCIHRVTPQRFSGSSSILMFFKTIQLSLHHFDLLLCGVAFPSAILALAANYITHIPYIIYSMAEDVTVVEGSLRKEKLLSLAFKRSQQNWVISNFTKARVEALGAAPKSVRVISPGIDAKPYREASQTRVEELREKFGLRDKRVILTVARLATRKGHDMIIRALPILAQDIPNIHYLIVGRGDRTYLDSVAKSAGVEDRVTVIDFVDDDDLPALFNVPDVYAMISRYDAITKEVEGFGIVYLEAGACGKPCVAGAAGGSADAVANNETGFIVDPHSTEEVTQALKVLLLDNALSTKMGEKARKRVHHSFDRTTQLRQIECLCIEATEQQKRDLDN